MAYSEEKDKLNHDEHFIDNDIGTEGVNPQHADFQPEQKKNNDVEAKKKLKPTKSDPIGYPDNAQLTERDASAEGGGETCVQNKDSTATEKEMARGDNIVEPNPSDIIEDKTNRGLKDFSLDSILKLD